MHISQLLVGVEPLNTPPDVCVDAITDDSRCAGPGTLFFAIVGTQSDGHNYISSALANGCAVVVSQRPVDGPHILVADSRKAMAQIAANFYGRPGEQLTLLCVTGTNGKTSVATLTAQLLTQLTGVPCGRIGTYGNWVGGVFEPAEHTTPGAIELQHLLRRMVDVGCTHCVMEASSHAVDQQRIGALNYKAGAFTNLTQDHLDYHGTMEAYYCAKRALFDVCELAIVNIDDSYGARLYNELTGPKQSVSCDSPADWRAEDLSLTDCGVGFTLAIDGAKQRVQWHTPGRFSVYNALTALALVAAAGCDSQQAADALACLPPVEGRMERVALDGAPFSVIVDFGHTPDAMRNALTAARGFTQGRLFVLFGCGGDRDRDKRPQMGALAVGLADRVFVTSDNVRSEDPQAIINDIVAGIDDLSRVGVYVDRNEAIDAALRQLNAGDVLITLGKGAEYFMECQGQRVAYDERRAIAESWERVRNG